MPRLHKHIIIIIIIIIIIFITIRELFIYLNPFLWHFTVKCFHSGAKGCPLPPGICPRLLLEGCHRATYECSIPEAHSAPGMQMATLPLARVGCSVEAKLYVHFLRVKNITNLINMRFANPGVYVYV